MNRRTRSRGQALVEFALVFPIMFFLLALSIDVFRVDWARTTVAEAARQGARQAVANTDPSDNAFGPTLGSCSGMTLAPGATGNGCLRDARIFETVVAVLGGFSRGATLTTASAGACPAPPAGRASVCIFPSEQGSPGTYADCASARTSLGRDPLPGDLGARFPEYSAPLYKGCFPVVVTVIYRYDTLVPFLGSAAPNLILITASTTMVAEY